MYTYLIGCEKLNFSHSWEFWSRLEDKKICCGRKQEPVGTLYACRTLEVSFNIYMHLRGINWCSWRTLSKSERKHSTIPAWVRDQAACTFHARLLFLWRNADVAQQTKAVNIHHFEMNYISYNIQSSTVVEYVGSDVQIKLTQTPVFEGKDYSHWTIADATCIVDPCPITALSTAVSIWQSVAQSFAHVPSKGLSQWLRLWWVWGSHSCLLFIKYSFIICLVALV